jgi:hypothetical protein
MKAVLMRGYGDVNQLPYGDTPDLKPGPGEVFVRRKQRIDGPEFGLSETHILNLERVAAKSEGMLGRSTIAGTNSTRTWPSLASFVNCGTTYSIRSTQAAVRPAPA